MADGAGLRIEAQAIAAVRLVTPAKFMDPRGYFSEVFRADLLADAGIGPFMQDNQSYSARRGTIRGLHCQVGPNAQGKLVRVLRGAIWDVAVDARAGSASFGRHVAAELSAANFAQLYVPVGFLHGFCTLTDDTEVLYKVTAPYDRAAERAVRFDDPTLALPWKVAPGAALLSDKDLAAGDFSAAATWFG